MSENINCWIWLSTLTGISVKKRLRLLEEAGGVQALWNCGEDCLKALGFLSKSSIESILDERSKNAAIRLATHLENEGISVAAMDDAAYPENLRNIYDPPIVLYIKGNLLEAENFLAVVGSRNATRYGKQAAEELSSEIARYGITVVSGIARGIDSSAHLGALRFGGRTVGVQGCGIGTAYPPENAGLMDRMSHSGAVISEYPPGVPPYAYNFPQRNRIISGMSLGVIVIEAGVKSGSLITAELALEQGREVFAVPGNINSGSSTGTNKLIKDGAKMVTCIEDILEELNPFLFANSNINGKNKVNSRENYLFQGLSAEERKIAGCLVSGPLHIDALSQKCSMSMSILSYLLTMMELKGIIEQAPGKVFTIKT